MAKLLRHIRDAGRWTEYEADSSWQHDDCPGGMLAELFAFPGISVWRVEDTGEDFLLRLVSILCHDREDIPPTFNFILFEEEIVPSCGLKLVNSPGKTVCDIVNTLHRDITQVTTLKFARFARLLLKNGQIDVFDRGRIIKKLAELHAAQEIGPPRRKPAKQPALLDFLWKQRYLSISPVPSS